MNVAVILSAGSGSRFGSDIPKQFINLAGRNIIEYTIEAFQTHPLIDEICIVADKKFHKKLSTLTKKNNYTKVQKIINGGKERKDSSYKAIKTYEKKEEINLIFHDAVRPFVCSEIITNSIEALKKYDAVDVAIPTADTIIEVENNTIKNIPQRSKLQRGQTPQAFKLKTIKKAHRLANSDTNEPIFTDDCGLVKQYLKDTQICVVQGHEKNIKITYPEDLLFAEKLIQLKSTTINSQLSYKKLDAQVVVIFGGLSGIGKKTAKLLKKHKAKVEVFSRKNGVDITNTKDIKKALKDVYNRYNKIDVVINSSAILTKKELINISKTEINQEITTNFTASVNIAKYSYKYLKQTKGSLILFTSSSYTRGRANYSLYSSTKAAVVNFSEAISQEWQKDNIKVNVINPARTSTPMRSKHFGKEDRKTLLKASIVAKITLDTILQNFSGLVIDVKKDI